MMKVATYLYFNRKAKEAIDRYQAVFGAEVICEYQYDDLMTNKKELLGKIFHAELKIADQNLYVSDVIDDGNVATMKFVVEFKDPEEAKSCLSKLVEDGRLISNFQKLAIGPTIAEVEDQFGIKWDVVIC